MEAASVALMEELDAQKLAQQLRQPEGEVGKEVALRLNKTNGEMIAQALQALEVQEGQTVLELGGGNGSHIPAFVEQTKPARFIGADISTTMVAEAATATTDSASDTEFDFLVYDGKSIPLIDNSVDRLVTANTVYFWEEPGKLLDDIYRVLSPGGRAVIAYVQKASMQHHEFAKYGFDMFDNAAMEQLFVSSEFKSLTIKDLTDQVVMPDGESIERSYSLAIAGK